MQIIIISNVLIRSIYNKNSGFPQVLEILDFQNNFSRPWKSPWIWFFFKRCSSPWKPLNSLAKAWNLMSPIFYQLFLLPKHLPRSLYLQSLNQRFCQSRLGRPFGHVTGIWMWLCGMKSKSLREIPFAIVQLKEKTSMILYICESIRGITRALC